MISEGSCDTENWSNDAENTALPSEKIHLILKYIKIEKSCNIISQYYCLHCIFDQINADLVSIRYLFQKH